MHIVVGDVRAAHVAIARLAARKSLRYDVPSRPERLCFLPRKFATTVRLDQRQCAAHRELDLLAQPFEAKIEERRLILPFHPVGQGEACSSP